MAGFTTVRDGVYTVLQTVTGATNGYFKVGFKYDKRDITDTSGEGYPYYTVTTTTDRHAIAYRGTVNNWQAYTVIVTVFFLYTPTEANETAFLTLLDLALTALQDNDNITLNGTVSHCLVDSVKIGYNDESQPTLRLAEIECAVTRRHDRTA